MHRALYRKWRPLCFEDVLGQPHITQTLKAQSKAGRLSHAYLFCGPKGTGKTTCARILAKAANCLDLQDGDPCNACTPCVGVNDGSAAEVIEMDAATYTSVDDIRALREEAYYSPSQMRKKVYIIDEVHMLSMNAFNAFLKILEEPPAHVMFILASTEIHKIPATILSRCQRFEFRRISGEDIAKNLLKVAEYEKIPLTKEGGLFIAAASDGAMRNGLSMLEQVSVREGMEKAKVLDATAVAAALGLCASEILFQMVRAISDGDDVTAVELFGEMYASGIEPAAFCDQLLCLFRDMLVLPQGRDIGPCGAGYSKEEAERAASQFTKGEILSHIDALTECLGTLQRSPNKRISVEVCLLSMCSRESYGALAVRMNALEEKINSMSFDNAGKSAQLHEEENSPKTKSSPLRATTKEEQKKTTSNKKKEPQEAEKPFKDPSALISVLRDQLNMSKLMHLKLCDFYICGDEVCVRSSDTFTFEQINDKNILEAVGSAASELLGRECCAKAECRESKTTHRQDPLSSLVDFARGNPDIAKLR